MIQISIPLGQRPSEPYLSLIKTQYNSCSYLNVLLLLNAPFGDLPKFMSLKAHSCGYDIMLYIRRE